MYSPVQVSTWLGMGLSSLHLHSGPFDDDIRRLILRHGVVWRLLQHQLLIASIIQIPQFLMASIESIRESLQHNYTFQWQSAFSIEIKSLRNKIKRILTIVSFFRKYNLSQWSSFEAKSNLNGSNDLVKVNGHWFTIGPIDLMNEIGREP